MILVKRVRDPAAADDGVRFLVDRLWPRGLRKDQLQFDDWLKDVAPSDDLRKWFGHDPLKWDEFRHRYQAELDRNQDAVRQLLAAARRGNVTLLFGAHDTDHNNATALREYLQEVRLGHTRVRSHPHVRRAH